MENKSNKMKKLELEAEKSFQYYNSSQHDLAEDYYIGGFVAGATSTSVEINKIEFSIERLNKLDSELQCKVMVINDMINELDVSRPDDDRITRLRIKIEGIRFSKEMIRREIKDLQDQLLILNNNETN